MTYSHLLTAVLSFAVGVLVMDIAYDYRDMRYTRAHAQQFQPAPVALQPYICAHQRAVSTHRGCV